ncbi:hypothetical protein JCM3766R1_001145 [Sporobolomyces carnicolor]
MPGERRICLCYGNSYGCVFAYLRGKPKVFEQRTLTKHMEKDVADYQRSIAENPTYVPPPEDYASIVRVSWRDLPMPPANHSTATSSAGPSQAASSPTTASAQTNVDTSDQNEANGASGPDVLPKVEHEVKAARSSKVSE